MDFHFAFSIIIYLLVICIIHYLIIINRNLNDNSVSKNIISEESPNVINEESYGIDTNEINDMIISNEDIEKLDNNIVDFNNDEFNEQNAKDELLKYLNNESHKKPALVYNDTKDTCKNDDKLKTKKDEGLLNISAYDDLDFNYASFQSQ